MANYELTKNIDTIVGTAGNDVFNARPYLTGNGMFASSLQQFDSINGGAGTDTLNATLIADSAYLGQAYLARPTLTGIENLSLTSFSNMSGMGDDNQAASTLDLGASTGVASLTSIGSNNQLRITNAGNITNYALLNSQADDVEDGLIVSGITRSAINVRAANVQSDDGIFQTMRFAAKSGYALGTINFTATNANVRLDASINVLNLISAGATSASTISMTDSDLIRLTVGGVGSLALYAGGILNIASSIDASAMTGPFGIDSSIQGTISSYKGGSGKDLFAMNSSTTGPLMVALGAGDNFALIESATASAVSITALGGQDIIQAGATGRLTLDSGAGVDFVLISTLKAGGGNSIRLGEGDDLLDVTRIVLDLDPSDGASDLIDGGAGVDTLHGRAEPIANLSVAQLQSLKGFEILSLTRSSFFKPIDMAGLPSINRVIMETGSTNIYLDNVRSGMVFQLEGNGDYGVSLLVNDTANDSLTFRVGTSAARESGVDGQGYTSSISIIVNNAAGAVETVNFISDGGFASPALADGPAGDFSGFFSTPASDYNAVYLDAFAGTTRINISGNEDISLAPDQATMSAVTMINASALVGALDLTKNYDSTVGFFGMRVAAGGASIIGGKGDDFLVGSVGRDSFGLSAGGRDTILFVTRYDSDQAAPDVINSFKAGDDKIAFNANSSDVGIFANADVTGVRLYANKTAAEHADGNITLDFGGNFSSLAAVNARLAAMHQASEDYGAAFDTSTHTLYIDGNQNGMVDATDTAIVLNGLSGFLWSDFVLA